MAGAINRFLRGEVETLLSFVAGKKRGERSRKS